MLSTNFPEFNLRNKSLPGVAVVTPNPMSNCLVKQKIEKKHPQATNELQRGGAVIYQRKKHFIWACFKISWFSAPCSKMVAIFIFFSSFPSSSSFFVLKLTFQKRRSIHMMLTHMHELQKLRGSCTFIPKVLFTLSEVAGFNSKKSKRN